MDNMSIPLCPICDKSLRTGGLHTLSCGHVFHLECLQLRTERGGAGFERDFHMTCPARPDSGLQYKSPIQHVYVLIHSGPDGELLLHSSDNINWSLPGGEVPINETPEELAHRTLKMKLGMDWRYLLLFDRKERHVELHDSWACFVYPTRALPMKAVWHDWYDIGTFRNMEYIYRAKWQTVSEPSPRDDRWPQWILSDWHVIRHVWRSLHHKYLWPTMWGHID